MSKEAMKLALEALNVCEVDGYIPVRSTRDAIKALEEALAKQEQGEPVAVIGGAFQLVYCRKDWSKGLKVGDKLYTTPQQRKPLTDEQIDDAIWRSHKVESNYAGWVKDQRRIWARAIEAAHGIKE